MPGSWAEDVEAPVLVRCSAVVGSRGSADKVRDTRGFATNFSTAEGTVDLVGNNIPEPRVSLLFNEGFRHAEPLGGWDDAARLRGCMLCSDRAQSRPRRNVLRMWSPMSPRC